MRGSRAVLLALLAADARAAEEQAASDLGIDAGAVGAAWDAQGVTASWQPSC